MPLPLLLFIAVFAQCVAAAEPTYRGKDGGLLFDGLPFIEVLFQRVLYSYVYAWTHRLGRHTAGKLFEPARRSRGHEQRVSDTVWSAQPWVSSGVRAIDGA